MTGGCRLGHATRPLPFGSPVPSKIDPVALDRARKFRSIADLPACSENRQILQVPEMNRAERFITVRKLIFPVGFRAHARTHYFGTAPEIDVRVELIPRLPSAASVEGIPP